MRLLCLVNNIDDVVRGNATTSLLHAALRRNHDVWVASPGDLGLDAADQITARAIMVALDGDRFVPFPLQRILVDQVDVLFLRTQPAEDPGRRWAHDVAFVLARMARQRGVLVLSDPDGLQAAASKLYQASLPRPFRPDTLVTRDPDEIRAFVEASETPVVLKPLDGTRGRDVFRVHRDDLSNFNQIVDVLTRSGFAIVQCFLSAAREGDVRLLLLDGAPIIVDGEVAAVRRVPSGADFRSNLHAGGHTLKAEMTPTLASITDAIGPRLREDGIFLAGVDVIGDAVVEVNVFNPGGFTNASRFSGIDFAPTVVEGVERRLAAHRS